MRIEKTDSTTKQLRILHTRLILFPEYLQNAASAASAAAAAAYAAAAAGHAQPPISVAAAAAAVAAASAANAASTISSRPTNSSSPSAALKNYRKSEAGLLNGHGGPAPGPGHFPQDLAMKAEFNGGVHKMMSPDQVSYPPQNSKTEVTDFKQSPTSTEPKEDLRESRKEASPVVSSPHLNGGGIRDLLQQSQGLMGGAGRDRDPTPRAPSRGSTGSPWTTGPSNGTAPPAQSGGGSGSREVSRGPTPVSRGPTPVSRGPTPVGVTSPPTPTSVSTTPPVATFPPSLSTGIGAPPLMPPDQGADQMSEMAKLYMKNYLSMLQQQGGLPVSVGPESALLPPAATQGH